MSEEGYYWGFRQVRLGKSLAESTIQPGSAVLNGPYATEREAEKARQNEAGNWDAATSFVFHAATKKEAQSKVEEITPKK
jgi:hypothetical protein